MLKGTVVENSLIDRSMLDTVLIEKTYRLGDWVLHDVIVDENVALGLGKHLKEGPWYVHLWESNNDDILVIFKGKSFAIKYSDKNTWKDAIAYGRSIGIPEKQLDFPIN